MQSYDSQDVCDDPGHIIPTDVPVPGNCIAILDAWSHRTLKNDLQVKLATFIHADPTTPVADISPMVSANMLSVIGQSSKRALHREGHFSWIPGRLSIWKTSACAAELSSAFQQVGHYLWI